MASADEQESQSLKSADIWRTNPSIPSPERHRSDDRNESQPFYKRMLPNKETRTRMDRKFKDFFGLGEDDAQEQKKWLQRRACLMDKSKCKLKDGACMVAMSRGEVPRRPVQLVSYDVADGATTVHADGRDEADTKRTKYHKDSVLTMAWEGCKSLVGATAPKRLQALQSTHSRSFRKSKMESAPQKERHPLGAEGDTFFVVRDDIPREQVDVTDSGARQGGRIPERVLRAATSGDQTDRRKIGRGFLGRIFNRQLKRVGKNVNEQMEKIHEHRPYFTYWVTFVQIVVYIVSVSVYGIAPIGFGVTETKGLVLKSSLAHEYVALKEVENFWIGPRQADLIHLGAKYSPCMRRDDNIVRLLDEDRQTERMTGCCVNEVDNVCVQKSSAECAGVISSWVNCSDVKGSKPPYCRSHSFFRSTGPVCGLDPRHCEQPSAMFENVWVNDITSWPICKKTKPSLDIHMSCEITGRPCCVGIQGQCTITTREHCSLLRGHFHEEAFLCSQVSCLDDICGMIGFSHPDHPDQVYRLWLSLFLHAGLFHVILTVVFQMLIMRDVEKLAGAIRIATIYTISGIAGNLASATFLPYQVEAGPAGSQFGILAMLFVEVIQSWQMLASPGKEIGKLVGIVLVLFVLGLLPWIDNYAHLIGFFVGFLMSFALLPYVTFGASDKRRKLIGVILSLVTVIAFLVLLMLLFYVVGVYECVGCSYFNCIPFTADFCRNMKVTVGRAQIYS